jgi:uroporphyrinogen-III decarboxylase
MFNKPDNWSELSWREKRDQRFETWRAAEGVSFVDKAARERHDASIDRTIKAIKIEELPDRVPIHIAAGSYPSYYAGYDLKTTMFNPEKLREAWLKFARDFVTDGLEAVFANSGAFYELMQTRTNRWPGGGLPDDATMIQFVEKEYMAEDEYGLYFRNPTDYILRRFLPRVHGVFEPLARLGPLDSFSGTGHQLMMAAGQPEFKQMAETLLAAHEAAAKWNAVVAGCEQACREMGYPAGNGGFALAPFDTVADMLRATHGSVMDMFRRPDELLELVKRILPTTLETAIRLADLGDCPFVFIPMHKGDDTFMSDRQFEKFYWPSYRKLLLGLIEEGLVPQPVVDGAYNRRLEYIKDLPKSGVIWVFEKTDMALAKKVLGGHTCISGNITSTMLCTGTPESVREYCRWLIDTCAPGGGYILAMGSSLAGRCQAANLHAMIDAGLEYGVYKK